ncbi:hypothetical protein MCAP1_000569 [Malassezia caprae]|uniref:Uncharacterized protein n=1 Tax=Malassezia caprae TaxID=1381934 RepID=A0AAF0IV44_9BASI|nr:hypothetical protein MCAP1_000569 [Malassezia caprae]
MKLTWPTAPMSVSEPEVSVAISGPHFTTELIITVTTEDAPPRTYPPVAFSRSIENHPTVTATTGYAFLNTQSVILPTTATYTSTYDSSADTTTLTTSSVTVAPPSWPEIVVPSDMKGTQPSNATLISILFQRNLSWYWIVTQRATTAQIFTYMPKVLSAALNISESQVYTSKLMMFKPLSDEHVTRTLYLGYVPSDCTAVLKALVQDPDSGLYQQSGSSIEQELVSLIDTTFDPLTYAKSMSDDQHGTVAPQTRNVLVGSFSGAAGAVLLGVLAWWLRKRYTQQAGIKAASKRNTIQSFVDCSAPRNDADAPAQVSQSYFAGDNEAAPSESAFESPCGVTGTIGLRHTAMHTLPTWSPVPVKPSRTPSSVQHNMSYLRRTEQGRDAAESHEQLVPYVNYMEGLDPTLWDGHSFTLEEQGDAQQRKNDVLECRVVV